MKQNETIIKSPEPCYLIGVLQGDGCLYKYYVNRKGKRHLRHMVMIEAKDLEMIKRAKEIFEKIFNRKRKSIEKVEVCMEFLYR